MHLIELFFKLKKKSVFEILTLDYSVRRVELIVDQQSDEFSSGKSECTLMLMSFYLSILFLLISGEFAAVVLHMAGSFN